MFGFLQRLSSCCASGARLSLLVAFVFCSIFIASVSSTVLEVEPREVLIRSPDQQERQEQQLNGSSSSEVVREALFSCLQVESDESRHRPRSEVIWMKDGQVIVTQGNRKYRNYGKKKRLLINNTNVEDSGIYECALSPNATEKGRAELWIVPEVVSAPTPQILQNGAEEGGDVGVVKCQVSLGTQYIEWWKDNVLLAMLNLTYDWTGGEAADHDTKSHHQDSRYSILHNGSLIISSLSSSDTGLYSCVAANKAGQKGRDIQVTINGSDVNKELAHEETTPPSVDDNLTTKNSSHSISNGNCVEYYDITFGPNPKLRDLQPPPSIETSTAGGEEVHSPFFTSLSPPCVQSLVGYRVVLNCSAGGSPSPNITWKRDGEPLRTRYYQHNVLESHATHQAHYVQLADGSLLINPVQVEDGGVYVCRAANQGGEITEEVRLTVRKSEEVCGVRDSSKVDKMEDGSGGSGEEKNHFQRRKRIVYGEAVDGIHEWPWQVLIEYAGNDLLCGGTLIRPDFVLTAAHCLHSSNMYDGYRKVEAADLIVKVGVYNRSKTEPHQQLLKVRYYVLHRNYRTTSRDNDIALLKLLHPVKLTSHVGLACLPSQSAEPPEGTACTITGWGHLQYNAGWSPEVLHTAQVLLVSYSACRNTITHGSQLTHKMLCAGWPQGGPDACQNDSGGPLVCPIPDSPERWALYGVVNFGTGCGLPDEYGVYARVTRHLRWINQQIT